MKERTAIEALRAGVPNRAAIRELGTSETSFHEAFLEKLDACRAALASGQQPSGMIIAGGFGTGKSHLLGFMREVALSQNFVVSLVPISKETPLFDPGKVFEAAVRNAEVPAADGDLVNDDLMTAVLHRLRLNEPAYAGLEQWASSPASGLAPLFAALLYLIPKPQLNLESLPDIARFFGGGRLSTAKVRQWLRDVGAAKLFDVKQPRMAELAIQRLRFAPRLVQAAGYSGWCILLDETELIGRYSPLQRGRSYAELCRWLGLSRDASLAGVVSVCAITDDFAEKVIDAKMDDERIPQRLEDKGLMEQANWARIAMPALEKEAQNIRLPDAATLSETLARVGDLYRRAYDWRPSEIGIGERLAGKTMRQYIKSWITAWDIERLYGERPDIAVEAPIMEYNENVEYERAPLSDDLAEGDN